jgi:hypothetical protein
MILCNILDMKKSTISSSSNLNNSEIILGRENQIDLKCFADGVPKPSISWFKVK